MKTGALFIVFILLAGPVSAQRIRITGPVDNASRVTLAGHMAPGATPANDQGRVPASMTLQYMTLVLKPSAAEQADLDSFLAAQQDPASPDYHHWLTPEQYAARFGVAQADIDKIASWLKSQNLSVVSVARGRNSIAFSGPVRRVESAFGTEIHYYAVNGQKHFANVSEPSVPAAFGGLVGAIHGLHDFRMRPLGKLRPLDTTSSGNYLAPGDFATIYDVTPLYNAGIDGTGQKIAVAGQTQINLSDIDLFRSHFNLPANDPQIMLVPNTTDPGISKSDLSEADLDIELSGAVARNASILYVYSDDVVASAQYAIDQNLAPVLSISYGLCEAQTGNAGSEGLVSLQTFAEQANAQGITWFAASGDNGAADCYDPTTRGNDGGLAVDNPASIPQVTGVGGTTFNEGSGTYWNPVNDANRASALKYIPETTWNDSANDGVPSASGGGVSIFYAKPSWQTGPGVPSDGFRDVPDVALAASADHDGYVIATNGSLAIFGGTSCGAPSFAGIAALLNHYLMVNGIQAKPGLGNINPRLYALAQTAPAAFHDVTSGNNIVNPCQGKSRSCVATPIGYDAGPGYDQATGLGSVDVFNLVTAWHQGGSIVKAPSALSVVSNSSTFASSLTLTATVTGSNGGTPTGTVTFSLAGTPLGTGTLSVVGGKDIATLTLQSSLLAAGANGVTATYAGDTAFAASTANVAVTVGLGLGNAGSFQQAYAPGMIMAVFGSQLAGSTMSAASVPLPAQLGGVSASINGIPAPLYFVSPGQINLQIPYAVPANSTATLNVTYNGQSASGKFLVASAAPGIFTSAGVIAGSPTASAGQIVALYLTGDGVQSPQAITGSTPAANTIPKPTQAVSITVGGVPVPTPFAFIGVPSWSIGVTQINFTVPAGVAPGIQPVVVTVGGVESAAANITIQ